VSDAAETTDLLLSLASIFGGKYVAAGVLIARFLGLGGFDPEALIQEFERRLDIRLLRHQNADLKNDIDGIRERMRYWAELADARGNETAEARRESYRGIQELNSELIGLRPRFFSPPEGEEIDTAPLVLEYTILRLTVFAAMALYHDQVLEDLTADRTRLLVATWTLLETAIRQAVARRLSAVTAPKRVDSVLSFKDGDRVVHREDLILTSNWEPQERRIELHHLLYTLRVRRDAEAAFLDQLAVPLFVAFRELPLRFTEQLTLPRIGFRPPLPPLGTRRAAEARLVVEPPATPRFELPGVRFEFGRDAVRAAGRVVTEVSFLQPIRVSKVPTEVSFSTQQKQRSEQGASVVGEYRFGIQVPQLVGLTIDDQLRSALVFRGYFALPSP